MGVRILWSCNFIRSWYDERNKSFGWGRVLPRLGTLATAVVVGAGVRVICGWGIERFVNALVVAGAGGLSLVCCMYAPFSLTV